MNSYATTVWARIEMSFSRFAAHVSACLFLFFAIGPNIYSLSIDVAHHFLLIDYLTKENLSGLLTDPAMTPMAHYPRGAHWIAAGLGVLIASPYAAMWLLCIIAIYLCYYSLTRLADLSGGVIATTLFMVLILVVERSGAVTGKEIVVNFFYSQILGTAILFSLLLVISPWRDHWKMVAALIGASALMEIHLLPALNLLGSVGCVAVLNCLIKTMDTQSIDIRGTISVTVFGVLCIVLLAVHPAFAEMRMIAANDGALNFAMRPAILFIAAALVGLISLAGVLLRRTRSQYGIAVVSALLSSLSLMALQWIALSLHGDGSAYAVKKHLFIVVPLALLATAQFLSTLVPQVRVVDARGFLLSVGVAVILTLSVYPSTPVAPIRNITKPLNFASDALQQGFPKFRPGNTAIIANSVDPVTKYMINLDVFKNPFDDHALSIITGKFDWTRPEYLMVDRSEADAMKCSEVYAEGSSYAIVPSACALPRN